MVDEMFIRARLKTLEQYISDLKSVKGTDFEEFQSNKVLYRFVERTLQIALEACLDVGNHIISSEGYREPAFSRDVFLILFENGWIDKDLHERLRGMVGFRNILVHDYVSVEPNIVYTVLQKRIPDLETFAVQIMNALGQK